jgi:glycosyltransferase involved in cell wall biosynthesis
MLMSIICVTKDDLSGIKKTIDSILSLQEILLNSIEVIIVNGGAPLNESMTEDLSKICGSISIITGQDRSLYHAMNIGINKAKGELLWMLNGGDVCNSYALTLDFNNDLEKQAKKGSVVVYQTISHDGLLSMSDYNQKRFVHQGIIYPKLVHETHGMYVDWKKFTAADYLFFYKIFEDYNEKMVNNFRIISRLEAPGLSSNSLHFICRDFVLFLEGKESIIYFSARILKTYLLHNVKNITKFLLSAKTLNYVRKYLR